jgi:site-specific DNA recombinase
MKEQEMELRFGEYIRYSTKKQTDGLSEQYQSNYNHRLINKVNGVLIDQYKDKGTSGYHTVVTQRPEMVKLINNIKSGNINCIVFYEESRLSRRIIDFYVDFLEPILAVNPKVKFFKSSTGEEWDPNSDEAKQNLIAAYNESAKKAAIAKSSQKVILDEGKRPGGKLPYGIKDITRDSIYPNEDIIIVLYIFHLASWGYSERKIAKQINSLELQESKFTKRKWDHSSIHYILNNPIYIGVGSWDRRFSKHNSTPKPMDQISLFNEFAPVIPMKLWKLAHVELNRKNKMKATVDGTNSNVTRMSNSFLLTDILTCAKCNGLLKAKNSIKNGKYSKKKTRDGRPLKYYFCPNCDFRIDSEELENIIIEKIKQEIFSHFSSTAISKKVNSWIKHIQEEIQSEKEMFEWYSFQSQKINKLKKTLTIEHIQLLEMISKNQIEKITHSLSDYQNTLDELKNIKQDNILNILSDRLFTIGNKETLLNNIEKRYLLFSAIEQLTVKPTKNGIKIGIEYRDIPLPTLQNQLKFPS